MRSPTVFMLLLQLLCFLFTYNKEWVIWYETMRNSAKGKETNFSQVTGLSCLLIVGYGSFYSFTGYFEAAMVSAYVSQEALRDFLTYTLTHPISGLVLTPSILILHFHLEFWVR